MALDTVSFPRVTEAKSTELNQDLQWCWITKSLSKITLDIGLRGEINLLKHLGGHGNAASPMDMPKGCRIHIFTQKRRNTPIDVVAGSRV